jgi:membrane protease YdiL (CAAX protease family)
MHIVDHIFILLLFVVQPIHGAYAFRRYVARVEAGEPSNLVRMYLQTLVLEWVFLAALAIAWFTFNRPVAELGFVAPGGVGFWSGTALLALVIGYMLYAWKAAKHMSDDERAKQVQSLGKLVHVLPHTRRDLRHFIGLSITAGIVEEIVYRGFVLWDLGLFMPLWAAVVASSVAFGIGHSYQGAMGALRCGLIGLVFAVFYIVTGSIWLPIIGHAILDILQGMSVTEILRKDSVTAEPQSA